MRPQRPCAATIWANVPEGEIIEGDGSPKTDQGVDYRIHGTVSARGDECADAVVERGTNLRFVAGSYGCSARRFQVFRGGRGNI